LINDATFAVFYTGYGDGGAIYRRASGTNVLHIRYHLYSLVWICAKLQDLPKIFLQGSQKLEDLKILEVVNITGAAE
jgi:hypothetical protein